MTTATIPRIDPRLRQRRIAVRRSEGRRRMRRLLVFLGVTLCVGTGVALTRSPLLDVDRIVVEGLDRTARSTAAGAIAVERGTALADVDTGAVEARLEALPWVADAVVERRLPGTVRVVVRERIPVAVVADDDGDRALVDRTGRILAAVATSPPGLTAVVGLDDLGAPGTELRGAAADGIRLAGLVPEVLGGDVDAVSLGDDGLEVGLQSGGVVRVGDGRQLGDKLLAAAAVLAEHDLAGGVLDVRVPASPVLTGSAVPDIPSTDTRG